MTDQPTSPAIQPPESEIHYRILFENSPVSIWEEDFSAVKTLFDQLRHESVTDIEAYFEKHPESVQQCADLVKIIDVNRATLKLHGAISKEELLAGLANTFTPDSFNTFREELACLWHGETELQRDAVVKTLAGEPRNVSIYFTVCPGYEETLGRVFVSLIDITERKQSEQALFDSELRMTRFIANLPAFFFTFRKSADGRLCFPYASPGIKTLYGLEPKDVREDMAPLHMLAHPEDRPHIEACLEEAFSTLEPFHMEYRVCRPGMPERWLECRSITVPDSDGNPLWHGIMLDITERKQAAEALVISERQYRTLAGVIPDNIIRYDHEGRVTYLNPTLEKTLGIHARDRIGKRVREFHTDGSYEAYAQALDTVLTTGKPIELEFILPKSDPPRIHTMRIVAEHNEQGGITGALAISHDITALKQTELQLKHALSVTESIINAIPDILFEVDENGVYLNVWTRNPERLAAPKEELLGKRADEILPPEAAAKAMAAIRDADENGISLENIIRLDLPDGSHWFEHSLSKIPSDDPTVKPHFLVLSRDVTERMQIEQELRASEQRFHAIFNQSFQFIGLMSTDGILLEANHAATEFTGVDKSEVLGKPFWEGPWWSHSTELKQQVRDAVRDAAGGQFVRMEVTHPDMEGNLHYVDFSLTPVTDPDGKVIQLIPEGRDITERKLTEEALRHEQTLLNRIMVTSPVGIAMVNREGQIIFANPQAEKILGLNKETITQLSYNAPEWHATTIDGKPLPDEAQPFSRVMAAREPVFDVQHAITWPDGRRVLLSVNGAPIFDAQNEIEAVAFAIEDITERKQVEKELLDARLLFEGVVEQSPVPMALAK
ncbi:MAG: PAS domain S-box protein, partial [Candidatus Thiodiazotropha sp.]